MLQVKPLNLNFQNDTQPVGSSVDPVPPEIRKYLEANGYADFSWGRCRFSEREVHRYRKEPLVTSPKDEHLLGKHQTLPVHFPRGIIMSARGEGDRRRGNPLKHTKQSYQTVKGKNARGSASRTKTINLKKEGNEMPVQEASEDDEPPVVIDEEVPLNFLEHISISTNFPSHKSGEELSTSDSRNYFKIPYIWILGDDVLTFMFSFLDYTTYARSYRVCKRFNRIFQGSYLRINHFLLVQRQTAIEQDLVGSIWDVLDLPDMSTFESNSSHNPNNLSANKGSNRRPSNPKPAQISLSENSSEKEDILDQTKSQATAISLSSVPEGVDNPSLDLAPNPASPLIDRTTPSLFSETSGSITTITSELTDSITLNNPPNSPISLSVTPEIQVPAPQIYNVEDILLTMNEIIGLLTDPLFFLKSDDDFTPTFVLFAPFLCELEIIILKLIQRYYVPLKENVDKAFVTEKITVPIRRRVCILFQKLIIAHWHNMSPSAKRLLKCFILSIDENRYLNFLSQAISRMSVKKEPKVPTIKGTPGKPLDIFEFTPADIAKTLAIIEWENFKCIQPEEFLRQTWTKHPDRAPFIRAMIDRFNKITAWIVTWIVSAEKIKLRVKRFKHFLRVAEESLNLGDYHNFMAVLSGLNENAVFRLKHTMAENSQKTKDLLANLNDIMSVENSYSNYRKHLASRQFSQPTIPYIGVWLRDLTYMDEGLRSEDKTQFNRAKMQGTYGIVYFVQQLQTHSGYPPEVNEKLDNYLRHLPGILPMEKLLEISRTIEPKNCTRDQIE